MVSNANVEPAAAEDEAGLGEELDVAPSTSRGRRTSSRRLFQEAKQGATTTTTGDGGGGDDDDDDLSCGDGGEQTPDTSTSSASSKPYQHGPSSLPDPPLLSRHPVIRPVGK
jgi:hypothetical protein